MAERKVKMKFCGTPFILTIDHRSVTLKRENKPNDKFPTPMGYHRGFFTLVDTLYKYGFSQVKGDLTVKNFAKQIREMWLKEIKPFILDVQENQSELTKQLIEANDERNAKLRSVTKLVQKGDYQGAAKIAKHIELE